MRGPSVVFSVTAVLERAAAATGNETIEVSSREVTHKPAGDFVGESGRDLTQKYGNRVGQTIGRESEGGMRNFRDDGDHLNLVNKATGGNLHVKFPGGR